MPTLHSLGEFGLIRHLKKLLPSVSSRDWSVGVGDDAAVRLLSAGRYELFTQDLLLEGVHFLRGKLEDFAALGWKALAVNLSDIAAMGGRPVGAVIGIGLPKGAKLQESEALYRGLARAARRFAGPIVGGDTNASQDGWVIAVTVLGETRHRPLLRSRALHDDSLWVTGELGTAALGWLAFQKKKKDARTRVFQERWALPEPRLAWGALLAKSGMVGAMIDLSDGLAGDLGHLAAASKLGFEVDLEKLPRRRGFEELCKKLDANPEELLLSGGEDYELLFTVRTGNADSFNQYLRRHRLRAVCIGHARRKMGINWLRNGRRVMRAWRGFRHF